MEANLELIQKLIEDLGSPDNNTQLRAESRLIRIGAAAIDPLIEATRSPNPQVRWRAAHSLGRIGERRAFDAMVKLLSDPDGEVRHETVEALGELKDPRSVEPLIEVLKNEHVEETPADHSLSLMGNAAVPALVGVIESSASTEARLAAMHSFILMDWWINVGFAPAPVIPVLRRQLEIPELRLRAMVTLAVLGDESVAEPLAEFVGTEEDEYFDSGSPSYGLYKLGKPAVPSLIRVLKTGTLFAKERALHALGEIGDESAIGALRDVLADPELHAKALVALGKCGDARVLPDLLQLLREESDEDGLELAIAAIGEPAIDSLAEILETGTQEARESAAYALACTEQESAVEPLAKLLDGPNRELKYSAIESLGQLGENLPEVGRRCLDLIEKFYYDPATPMMQHAASWAASLRHHLGLPEHPVFALMKDEWEYYNMWERRRE